jgi:hypothetical protein
MIGALVVFCGVGCSKSTTTGTTEDPEAIHLDKVGELSEEFKKANNGKVPADLKELKTWAVNNGKATDDDFNSTRDKQPYDLRKTGNTVTIAEATGKDGKIYVVNPPSGKAALVNEKGYRMMLQGKPPKDKPPG